MMEIGAGGSVLPRRWKVVPDRVEQFTRNGSGCHVLHASRGDLFFAPPRPRWQFVIYGFLDDSGKEGQATNPYVVMAGYVGSLDSWLELSVKWLNLLVKHGISAIHMKDLIPLTGEYKTRGWDQNGTSSGQGTAPLRSDGACPILLGRLSGP